MSGGGSPVLPDLLETCGKALAAAEELRKTVRAAVSEMVVREGRIDPDLLERRQFAAHGLAWLESYVVALREMLAWAGRLDEEGALGEIEALILQAAFGEYLAQLSGGLAMSQVEVVRLSELGVSDPARRAFHSPEVRTLVAGGNVDAVRMRIATLVADGDFGNIGLGDETLEMVRDQFRRFTEERVVPYAHEWHLKNEYIPLAVVGEMAALGVFGLAVAKEYGGHGMGKVALCVVTEELSRGFLAVGSLGTRAEIAGELIRLGGTEEQKRKWLPKIAGGEILTSAVFTEPDIGSDLASISAHATRVGDVYRITGTKTWITHGARSDLMTLLVRTDPEKKGYRGLSMFLAEKPRGDDDNPFPAAGMNGSEIEVLGYRGMKEYEIAFDGYEIPASNLLGGVEGQGFKQLMATFEAARIQTAARAVGVAQNALELGLQYAKERVQFGKPIYAFPRIAGKIAWMAVETMIARQLAYFSARQKDSGRRCDIEAGMAKLLAARVAWANADNALQIHGGSGYALEDPVSRVLCDARILNIFEGAAEIQAQVIARRIIAPQKG